jgi:hypothetical protein
LLPTIAMEKLAPDVTIADMISISADKAVAARPLGG